MEITNQEPHTTLKETLVELKNLRDQFLTEDSESQAGLLRPHLALIFQRLQHDIPSDRENFRSFLRAAGLGERKTVEVKA